MDAIDLKNITPEAIVTILQTHSWKGKDIAEFIKMYGEQQVALDNHKKEPVPMARPKFIDFFSEDTSIGLIQKVFLENPELYNYTQALDSYIDCLEDKVLLSKPTDTKPVGSPSFHAEVTVVRFEYLAVGDEFECYGDIYMNYNYPKLCKCVKDSSCVAHEKDGGISFYIHPRNEVFIKKSPYAKSSR